MILDSDILENSDARIDIELVGVKKFILLEVLSFGLYGVWWMYKKWKFFKEWEVLDILPVARAIFGILFFYQLLEKIKQFALSNNQKASYPSFLLFILFFALNLSTRLPDPLFLISSFTVICFIQPITVFNKTIKSMPNYRVVNENKISSKQYVIIVLGAIFWMMVILGLLMSDETDIPLSY